MIYLKYIKNSNWENELCVTLCVQTFWTFWGPPSYRRPLLEAQNALSPLDSDQQQVSEPILNGETVCYPKSRKKAGWGEAAVKCFLSERRLECACYAKSSGWMDRSKASNKVMNERNTYQHNLIWLQVKLYLCTFFQWIPFYLFFLINYFIYFCPRTCHPLALKSVDDSAPSVM